MKTITSKVVTLKAFSKAMLGIALIAGVSHAQGDAQSWGPPVGSAAPEINAQDQDGVDRDLRSLSGNRGLLLVLSRSADW